MGIGYIFKKLGQQELGGKAQKERESAQANLRQAADSIETSQPADEIQALIDSGSRGMEQAAVLEGKNDELINRFVPNILKQLEEKYGIAEPPETFLLTTAAALLSETGGEEGLKLARSLEQLLKEEVETQVKEEKKAERKLADFTGRQEAIARTVLRLPKDMEEVPEEMSINEAISLVYTAEMADAGDDEAMRNFKISDIRNKKVSIGKTETFNRLKYLITTTLETDEQITIEEVGRNIDSFDKFPAFKEVLKQMVNIEAYRNKTLAELIDYVWPYSPIRLRGEESEENYI